MRLQYTSCCSRGSHDIYVCFLLSVVVHAFCAGIWVSVSSKLARATQYNPEVCRKGGRRGRGEKGEKEGEGGQKVSCVLSFIKISIHVWVTFSKRAIMFSLLQA